MSEALEISSPELVKLGPEKILWAPRLSGPIDVRWDAGNRGAAQTRKIGDDL